MDSTSTQHYIDILEKTNQQLSFWYLPYELAIGFLTITIALIAIGFTLLLWKQSADYKKVLKQLVSEHINEEVAQKTKKIISDELDKFKKDSRESSVRDRADTEEIISAIESSAILKKMDNTPLAEAQIQSILSLLKSFGADEITIENTLQVMTGRFPTIDDNWDKRTTITQAQKTAILSLLKSFGASMLILENTKRILKTPISFRDFFPQ